MMEKEKEMWQGFQGFPQTLSIGPQTRNVIYLFSFSHFLMHPSTKVCESKNFHRPEKTSLQRVGK